MSPTRAALTFVAAGLLSCSVAAQPAADKKGRVKLTDAAVKSDEVVYKKTPQGGLALHVYYPADWKPTDKRPAVVFFFGGGWKNGAYTQFVPHCEYLAARGLVGISADYRISSKHKTTPDVAVEDARTAMRYVRANAAKFGIDPDKLAAGGGSAGGHLAAATALLTGFDAADDPKASCVPNALVLFNPALNLTLLDPARTIPGADGSDISKAISPTLYLTKTAPPALVVFGTADPMLSQGKEYAGKAKALGVRAELYTAADQPHGFFNRSPWCEVTAGQMDTFLASVGYLSGEPTVRLPAGAGKLVRE
jgi:acetyl esterase